MNILAILGAATLINVVYAETNYVIEVGGTNEISAFLYGINTTAHHALTTNWVDDPVDKTLQLGIIYSNIIASVSYEGKTNDVTMASKLVGLAGTREKPPNTITWYNGASHTNYTLELVYPVDRGNLR